MSALDALYSAWENARETFGQGTPQDGSRFDGSSQLSKFQQEVGAAAPDERWQGPASSAYATKNKDHAATYGALAALDKRMSAEVTNAANVVATGRANLDQLKGWVDKMAGSIPEGTNVADRDTKLTTIANQGLTRLKDIVTGSHNSMNAIAGRMKGLTSEYQALGGRGGPKEDKGMQAGGDESKQDNKDEDGEPDKKKSSAQIGAEDCPEFGHLA